LQKEKATNPPEGIMELERRFTKEIEKRDIPYWVDTKIQHRIPETVLSEKAAGLRLGS
jgi:hypothetical protein